MEVICEMFHVKGEQNDKRWQASIQIISIFCFCLLLELV